MFLVKDHFSSATGLTVQCDVLRLRSAAINLVEEDSALAEEVDRVQSSARLL